MKARWILILFVILSIIVVPTSFAQDLDDGSLAGNNGTVPVNHYYFDSNVANEGNGSIDSPYKYLADNAIENNSVLHLANGEYNFTQTNTFKNVSFIGSEVSKTVVHINGNVTYEGHSILRNITFVNTQIRVSGALNVTNTIFKDCTAKSLDRYSNSYGGAISASKGSNNNYEVYVDNCTFINNYAQYGGAIYVYGGILDVQNSVFINNHAYNYGGAITGEYNSKVRIKNSNFTKSYSLDDAGGAIYLKSSNLEADNLNISDSNATFGGAITSLFTNSNLTNIYLFNNTAKYDGGAIYQVLGNLEISSSTFIKNNANNGAGLYVGRCDNVVVNDCLFEDNQAISKAKSLFSIINGNLTTNNLVYRGSYSDDNDFYNSQSLNLFISNGNYTMFSHDEDYLNSTLPSRYKLDNLLIKDQQDGGNCWAFAVLASLESCINKASGENIILSEENVKNIIALYSDYGWLMDTNYGGYDDMGIGYLVSWLGPVLQSDDLYDGQSVLSPLLDAVTHVQNIQYLNRNSYTDNDAIKRAIMKYGGVSTSLYMTGNTKQYYSGGSSSNHAVCIVGWDDDMSISRAPGKGAWICKNSWGNWGDGGFFYVSYYDVSCARVGVSDCSYVFIFNDTLKFDKNYQYDIPGKTDYFLNSSGTVWYKNRFTSTDNEYLAAVSTYFKKNTNWNVSVVVNNVLKSVKSGFSTPGYYTIELDDLVLLNPGDIFEVIFKIDVDSEAGVPISEAQSLVHQFYDENMSFISYDGINWADLSNLKWEYPGHTYKSQVACIKAFTFLNPVNTTLTWNYSLNEYGELNITSFVLNQYGKIVHAGKVIFTVNGVDYLIDVCEGIAKASFDLNVGSNDISAQYDAVGFVTSSESATISLSKIQVRMDLNISNDMDNVDVIVKLSRPINETVVITIANRTYSEESKNGIVNIKLENQDLGSYDVIVQLQSDIYNASDIHSSFTIAPFKTRIESDNVEYVFGNENRLAVRLLDENSNPVANQTIAYTLDSTTHTQTTDNNGFIYIYTNLTIGNHVADIRFDGVKMYSNSTATSNIIIKSSINLPDSNVYTYNSTYKPEFLDKSGNGFSGKVSITLDGVSQDVNAADGIVVLLNPGSHSVGIVNLATGEVKNHTINVVERIRENSDLTVYYESDNRFKVKVLDDNGNAAKNVQVTFNVNGKSYSATTDSNGYAYLNQILNPDDYTITSTYKGFSVTNQMTVKTTISLPSNTVYTYNSIYKAEFVDKSGNAFSGNVAYVLNGARYEVGAADGVSVALSSGTYSLSTVNLATGEVKNQTVKIVNRIQVNSDLITYYGSGDSFRVKVLDDNGNVASNVNVSFDINGQTFTATTDNNGYASLNINLNPDIYTITSTYKGFSVTNKITVKSTVSLPASTVYTYNSIYNASFIDKSGNKLSGNVAYVLNGVRSEVNADNGISILLNPGSYDVSVINLVTGEVKNQTISVIARIIENNDLITYYNSGDSFKVKVLDDNGNAAKNVQVAFTANGKSYTATTDSNGYAYLTLDLTQASYTVISSYKGYSTTNKITVKSTVSLPSSTVYTYNAVYRPGFVDKSGNKFSGKVAITVNSVKYEVNANDGVNVVLNPGNYAVCVVNLETTEVKNQTIQVVKRIQENSDLTVYYGSDNRFKVKVLDDNGNAAKNVQLTFTVDGNAYSATTDNDGYATLDANLNPNVYTITSSYKGFSVTNKMTVKTTVSLPANNVYTYNSVYNASFLDKFGNKLSGNVAYVLDGVRSEVNADNGVNVVLNPGSYVASVVNLATGEVKNQTIKVVARITENDDLITYYGSGDSFRVRVLDDNGNAAVNVNVAFNINGKTYSAQSDNNGYVSLNINLNPDVYTITSAYKGYSASNKITVKSTVNLPTGTVYTYNAVYRPDFLDKFGNKFTGKVAITINGVKYEVNANDGVNVVLNPGSYSVSVVNPETAEVKSQTIKVVARITENNDLVTYYNSGDSFKVKVLDDNGNPAKNVQVAFTANGKSYTISTDNNGYACLNLDWTQQAYTVTSSYKGYSTTNKITVKSTVELPSSTVYTYNAVYRPVFLDKSGNKFTGKVAITVNGVKYDVNANDGVNVVLNPGSYVFNIVNLATGEAKNQNVNVVSRIQENSDLTVYYGSDNRFKVKVLDDNGNAAKNVQITFTVDGNAYSATTDNDGYATLNVNFSPDVYTITSSYKGFSVTNKMTVKTTVSLPANNVYTYNSIYKADFLDKSGNKFIGNVAYVLNGIRYDVSADTGIDVVLNPGTYAVSVSNPATGEVKNQTVKVVSRITENNDLVTYYGSGDSFKVKVLDDNGNAAVNVNVAFNINGETYSTVTDNNGYASMNINLNPDVYTMTSSYKGFSAKNKITVKSTVELPSSDVYTYNAVYRPVFLDKSGNKFTGKVAITLNGVKYEVNANDGVNVVLNPGTYAVSVSNSATGEVKEQTIKVIERIQDNNDLITYYGSGDSFRVKVLDDNGNAAGNVNVAFDINGQTFTTTTDSNGYASLKVNLNPDVYTVTSAYNGFSVKNTLTVKSTISLPSNTVYTYNAVYRPVFLDKSGNKFTGKVAITVNGFKYDVNANDGVNVVLNPGSYVFNVVNLETGEAKNQNVNVVSRIQENSDLTAYYGSDNRFKVKVLDDNGNAAVNAKVTFEVDAKTYSVTTDNGGYATLNIVLPSNAYTVTAEYKGFSVKNKMNIKTTINLPSDAKHIYNSTYKANFTDSIGNSFTGKVAYVLNGIRYEVNANEGISLALNPDIYVVSVCNLLTGEIRNQTIEVIGKIMENEDLVTYYESGEPFKVKVLDDNMNVAKNVNVTFTIDNQTYSTVTDDEGYASLDISLPPDVYNITTSFGDYSVTDVVTVKSTIDLPASNDNEYNSTYEASFLDKSGNKFTGNVTFIVDGVKNEIATDDGIARLVLDLGVHEVIVFNPQTGEVINQTVNVISKIQENKDLKMYYGAGKTYKVKILDYDGKIAKNVEVTFKINGKTYTKFTNSKGYASIKIDKSFIPKTYTVTVIYKDSKVSNKIVVKPTLIVKNMAVKKGKTFKYTVKLLNNKGKILKNKYVKVKFKGKTYKAKTNSKGIATFKIKANSKLGKFTITSTYGSAKISKKITVKK